MELPSKFPEGSRFWASFSGDEFVELPDGSVFKLADSGDALEPRMRLPFTGCAPITESVFLNCARTSRKFVSRVQEPPPPLSRVLAWVDEEGGPAAFVFGPDGFSAVRDSTGRWVSPSPSSTIGDLSEDGYRRATDDEAASLAYLARLALSQA